MYPKLEIESKVTSNLTDFFQLLKEVEDLAIALALKIEDINNFKLEIGTEKISISPAREGYVDIKEFSKKLYSEISKTLVNTE
ncbi:MAG TPA: hypothetical protein VLH56_18015 [Dissulfurispiraceae bacterium]|jgi:hypothetical protein|nr:hypothetical protein [Dissulfurispiraceae bacterium]